MRALIPAMAVLLAAVPASAGDWDDYDDVYEDSDVDEDCCLDTYVYGRGAVYAPRVVVPHDYAYSAGPDVYGSECTITRKYRRGYVRERIECDDD